MNELIIDGTSAICFGDDDDAFQDEENGILGGAGENVDPGKYADIKRAHGYNKDNRPDLTQVNIMLGVNDWSMPLLFQVFPGNAPDVHMFASILEKLYDGYPALLSRVQSKHIVFNKENNNPGNVKKLDDPCERWGFYFAASARPSIIVVKNELAMLDKDNAPVIYTQLNTVLRGRTTTATLYGKPRKVLLYLKRTQSSPKISALMRSR